MRSFVAIDCSENLKENIHALIKKLDRGERNVRWIKKQGMHLTLKFLGEITDLQLQAVKGGLETAVKPFKPFELVLKGTGSFPPSARSPKVLWIGVEDSKILIRLQEEIERSLHKLGFPEERRSYRPHMTLGRVKKREGLDPVLDIIGRNREETFGKMTVEKVTLFKSTLKPEGAEYTVLSEFSIK